MATLRSAPAGVALAATLALAVVVTIGSALGRSIFLQPPDTALAIPLLGRVEHIPTILSADFMLYTEGHYRPLSYVLLVLLRTFFPVEATGFWHALLLGTHWLNAFLVARIVQYFSHSFWPALFAGLLMALHPLASVVTNNAYHFHFILGATLYLSALYLYLLAADRTPSKLLHAGSAALYLGGLLVTKATIALPFLLVAYEALYRRSDWRSVGRRMLPYVAATALVAPLWWLLRPHPLHFRYIDFPPGAALASLASVISASADYLGGILLGVGVPAPLHDLVPQIYSPASVRLWIMLAVDSALLIGAGLLLRRRHWGGLGPLAIAAVMLPYASTAWNNAHEYVSWTYVYGAVPGLALFLGWVLSASRIPRVPRTVVTAALWLLLAWFGWRQAHLNALTTSAAAYWKQALDLNPDSATANLKLGKAYAEAGDSNQALQYLFAAPVKQLSAGSQTMCRYYLERGDLVAAAVHLRMAFQKAQGIQFGHGEPLKARVLGAAGAIDHAEAALGKVLTSNPYDLDAMEQLVAIWLQKGHHRAARKIAARAVSLDPEAAAVRRIERRLEEKHEERPTAFHISPPSPSWLRYAAQGADDSHARVAIIDCAARHPDDPVLGLTAAVCMAREDRHGPALELLRTLTARVPSSAFGWAMRCWVATEYGALEEAAEAGRRALELDNRDATVHNTLGILYARIAAQQPDKKHLRERSEIHFREALALNPSSVSAQVNLGKELARQKKYDDAVALYRRALKLRPDLAEASLNLANIHADRGAFDAAIQCYQDAIRARRDYVQAHHNLGAVLAKKGDMQGAQKSFRRALEIDPCFGPASQALATVHLRRRAYGNAISELEERLTACPSYLQGYVLLARLHSSCPDSRYRNDQRAVALLQEACRISGNRHAGLLLALAQLRAKQGNLAGAAQAARRVLALPPARRAAEITSEAQGILEYAAAHEGEAP